MAQFHMAVQHLLEKRIHDKIPLSKQMGVKLKKISLHEATLSVPLEPNTNHKNTAFGGSVYAAAVLSCWALVTNALEQSDLDVEYVVIQDGQIDYVLPIDSDFEACASWDSEAERDRFLETLRRKGRARVSLGATVTTAAGATLECAHLRARFVAQLNRNSRQN